MGRGAGSGGAVILFLNNRTHTPVEYVYPFVASGSKNLSIAVIALSACFLSLISFIIAARSLGLKQTFRQRLLIR